MTIRDMCCAGINIEGRVQVRRWINDECEILFDADASFIGDQCWLDLEIEYVFSINDAIVFEVTAKED